MAELYITADLHIDHRSVVLYSGKSRSQFIYDNPDYDPDKPKNFHSNWPKAVDLEAHNEWIIEDIWNSTVTNKDTIIVVGDYIWKNQLKHLGRMKGHKILVQGNHDKTSKRYLANFSNHGMQFDMFEEMSECCMENSSDYLRHFTNSYEEWHKTFEKKIRVIFSHCPYLTWPSSSYGSWNVHGHCHGRLPEHDDVMRTDVGIDAWGQLVHWDLLRAKMTARYPKWKEKTRSQRGKMAPNTEMDTNREKNEEILLGLENKIKAKGCLNAD